MRALLADHDVAMLESVRRALSCDSNLAVEIATSKAHCIDLLRPGHCEILIACEQLEDGSGLELLSQVAQRWPGTLRVFAAEPSRLALLLGGRLAPFRLYQTLAYPIDPALLLPLLVQIRAHVLESVLPSQAFKTRGRPEARSPTTAPPQEAPAAPAHQPPEPAAPARESRRVTFQPSGYRSLAVGTALLVTAALVVLVLRLQSASSEGAPSIGAPPSRAERPLSPTAAADWNQPGIVSLVNEVELALARHDVVRARAALDRLRAAAPTHPRLGFFESLLREAQPARELNAD
jgi:hypothetical protein